METETESAALGVDELRLIDAYWRAANYLSVGQIYLLDNPLLREPLRARARQAAPARPLGHDARAELRLRPPEPGDQRAATWTRSSSSARATAARRWSPTPTWRAPTARSTRTSRATRTGCARLFRQFSFPGGIPSHVAPETPGLDPRGRRARLRARPRLRRRVRQPRPARLLRRRRRRGRDRAARGELALEQVPEPGARRRRAADPAPERLQDREPDRARADPATTSSTALFAGYGYAAVLRRGRRARRECTS